MDIKKLHSVTNIANAYAYEDFIPVTYATNYSNIYRSTFDKFLDYGYYLKFLTFNPNYACARVHANTYDALLGTYASCVVLNLEEKFDLPVAEDQQSLTDTRQMILDIYSLFKTPASFASRFPDANFRNAFYYGYATFLERFISVCNSQPAITPENLITWWWFYRRCVVMGLPITFNVQTKRWGPTPESDIADILDAKHDFSPQQTIVLEHQRVPAVNVATLRNLTLLIADGKLPRGVLYPSYSSCSGATGTVRPYSSYFLNFTTLLAPVPDYPSASEVLVNLPPKRRRRPALREKRSLRFKRWDSSGVCGWPVISSAAKFFGGECYANPDTTAIKDVLHGLNNLSETYNAVFKNLQSQIVISNEKAQAHYQQLTTLSAEFKRFSGEVDTNIHFITQSIVSAEAAIRSLNQRLEITESALETLTTSYDSFVTHFHAFEQNYWNRVACNDFSSIIAMTTTRFASYIGLINNHYHSFISTLGITRDNDYLVGDLSLPSNLTAMLTEVNLKFAGADKHHFLFDNITFSTSILPDVFDVSISLRVPVTRRFLSYKIIRFKPLIYHDTVKNICISSSFNGTYLCSEANDIFSCVSVSNLDACEQLRDGDYLCHTSVLSSLQFISSSIVSVPCTESLVTYVPPSSLYLNRDVDIHYSDCTNSNSRIPISYSAGGLFPLSCDVQVWCRAHSSADPFVMCFDACGMSCSTKNLLIYNKLPSLAALDSGFVSGFSTFPVEQATYSADVAKFHSDFYNATLTFNNISDGLSADVQKLVESSNTFSSDVKDMQDRLSALDDKVASIDKIKNTNLTQLMSELNDLQDYINRRANKLRGQINDIKDNSPTWMPAWFIFLTFGISCFSLFCVFFCRTGGGNGYVKFD